MTRAGEQSAESDFAPLRKLIEQETYEQCKHVIETLASELTERAAEVKHLKSQLESSKVCSDIASI